MDYVKTRAPFWKWAETAMGATWIDANDRDEAAAARWFSDPPMAGTQLRIIEQSDDKE